MSRVNREARARDMSAAGHSPNANSSRSLLRAGRVGQPRAPTLLEHLARRLGEHRAHRGLRVALECALHPLHEALALVSARGRLVAHAHPFLDLRLQRAVDLLLLGLGVRRRLLHVLVNQPAVGRESAPRRLRDAVELVRRQAQLLQRLFARTQGSRHRSTDSLDSMVRSPLPQISTPGSIRAG
eukprot:3647359-Prymnesium_polylepis.1